MKAKLLMISCGIVVLASGCGSGETKATEDTAKAAPADTTAVAPAPAEPAAPVIDSAAITKEYLAARKQPAKTPKPKKQGTQEVVMYSEAPIASHEAYEQAPATATTPKVIHTKEYVYFAPSEKASFPGGQAALETYIAKNIVYPEKALEFHVEGTVFADVYLDSIGHVTSVEFPANHLGYGLEEETATILMGTPRWVPAKENGVRVKSKITVPVTYKIKH